MAFADYETVEEIKGYLKKVLNRTGGKEKNALSLYHYTNVDALYSIMNSSSFWLASSDKMNDYLEDDYVKSASLGKRFFFMSFSKNEENLAMYKMYAPNPKGVVCSFSYEIAEDILTNIPNTENGLKEVNIVRNNILTKDTVGARIYWSAVCYKDLKTDVLFAETVSNNKIKKVFSRNDFAGFVKPYGWEFEREVRLCAITSRALEENEKVAIKIPDDIISRFCVSLCPGFEKKDSGYKKIVRMCNNIATSPHDGIVDLGENSNYLEEKINELQKKCESLEKSNAELMTFLENQKEESKNEIGRNTKFNLLKELIDWVGKILKMGDESSLLLEKSLCKDNPDIRKENYKLFEIALSEMQKEYSDSKGKYKGFWELLKIPHDFEKVNSTVNNYIEDIRKVGRKYLHKAITIKSLEENNNVYDKFYKEMDSYHNSITEEMTNLLF